MYFYQHPCVALSYKTRDDLVANLENAEYPKNKLISSISVCDGFRSQDYTQTIGNKGLYIQE